jgi:hypothetical protein
VLSELHPFKRKRPTWWPDTSGPINFIWDLVTFGRWTPHYVKWKSFGTEIDSNKISEEILNFDNAFSENNQFNYENYINQENSNYGNSSGLGSYSGYIE